MSFGCFQIVSMVFPGCLMGSNKAKSNIQGGTRKMAQSVKMYKKACFSKVSWFFRDTLKKYFEVHIGLFFLVTSAVIQESKYICHLVFLLYYVSKMVHRGP